MLRRHISLFVTLIWLLGTSVAQAANNMSDVRVWPSPTSTRVVFDFADAPEFTYFTLQNPERLVIDFADTGKSVDLSKIKLDGKRVTRIRTSTPKNKKGLRVVMELASSYKNVLFPLAPTAPYGNRLVVDLKDKSAPQRQVTAAADDGKKDIVIAIDAGHGGEDPGSIGPSGYYEKRVTLAIAKELARQVNAVDGLKAVMTRTGDYHIHLNKRPEMARKMGADLFVSIHADAFTTPQPSGASIWLLSLKRANTELGRLMEKGEKHSELLGGSESGSGEVDEYLNMTLFDLEMEHSMTASYAISQILIAELRKITKMHKKKPQHASLAVLKSPDVPSLLVETGFISNPREESNLKNRNHQRKLAKALLDGITQYFRANPPKGTLYYAQRSFQHKVKRGESLSLLASRYNVAVEKIKQANNLSTDIVRIGQMLTIPRS